MCQWRAAGTASALTGWLAVQNLRKHAVHIPLLNPIEKRLALVNHMNRIELQWLVTDRFPASMHYTSEIEDWCACRQHLRFLARKLNHAALKYPTRFNSVMKVQGNRGTLLTSQYPPYFLPSRPPSRI